MYMKYQKKSNETLTNDDCRAENLLLYMYECILFNYNIRFCRKPFIKIDEVSEAHTNISYFINYFKFWVDDSKQERKTKMIEKKNPKTSLTYIVLVWVVLFKMKTLLATLG